MTLPDAIRKVVGGDSLTEAEAQAAATLLMEGEATPAQIAALLVGLRMKGETVAEVTGFARAMRSHVVGVAPKRGPLLDTCGTGGSTFRVFNVSTAAAFVAAAAGAVVAKHGNRAMSGLCGSADVLEALGVQIGLTPQQDAACIDAVGVGFLFAQQHHPAMKQVAAPRREIGVRTLFNLLGPMTNPAGATRQVMGVYDAAYCGLVAETLRKLGSERALIVHGEIGLDEISTTGRTLIYELRDGKITHYVLTPRELGLDGPETDPAFLAPAPTPAENAALVRGVLSGKGDTPAALARHHLVAVNAAAALRVAGLAEDWNAAVRKADEILRSGQALTVLENLIAFTNSAAAGY